MISHDLKVVFVHIPKSGGTSVSKALEKSEGRFRPLTLSDFSTELLPPACHGYRGENAWNPKHIPARYLAPEYDEYFKFAFVRNPWDLVVSSFHWWIQNTQMAFRRLQGRIIEKLGFHDFVMSPYTDYINEIHHAGMGQAYFYLGHDARMDCVDMIGQFETLQEDFDRVCSVIGLRETTLPTANRSVHDEYPLYYDSLTSEMVARKFIWDVDRFGYRCGISDHTCSDYDTWLNRLRGRADAY